MPNFNKYNYKNNTEIHEENQGYQSIVKHIRSDLTGNLGIDPANYELEILQKIVGSNSKIVELSKNEIKIINLEYDGFGYIDTINNKIIINSDYKEFLHKSINGQAKYTEKLNELEFQFEEFLEIKNKIISNNGPELILSQDEIDILHNLGYKINQKFKIADDYYTKNSNLPKFKNEVENIFSLTTNEIKKLNLATHKLAFIDPKTRNIVINEDLQKNVSSEFFLKLKNNLLPEQQKLILLHQKIIQTNKGYLFLASHEFKLLGKLDTHLGFIYHSNGKLLINQEAWNNIKNQTNGIEQIKQFLLHERFHQAFNRTEKNGLNLLESYIQNEPIRNQLQEYGIQLIQQSNKNIQINQIKNLDIINELLADYFARKKINKANRNIDKEIENLVTTLKSINDSIKSEIDKILRIGIGNYSQLHKIFSHDLTVNLYKNKKFANLIKIILSNFKNNDNVLNTIDKLLSGEQNQLENIAHQTENNYNPEDLLESIYNENEINAITQTNILLNDIFSETNQEQLKNEYGELGPNEDIDDIRSIMLINQKYSIYKYNSSKLITDNQKKLISKLKNPEHTVFTEGQNFGQKLFNLPEQDREILWHALEINNEILEGQLYAYANSGAAFICTHSYKSFPGDLDVTMCADFLEGENYNVIINKLNKFQKKGIIKNIFFNERINKDKTLDPEKDAGIIQKLAKQSNLRISYDIISQKSGRTIEVEIFPEAGNNGLANLGYSPNVIINNNIHGKDGKNINVPALGYEDNTRNYVICFLNEGYLNTYDQLDKINKKIDKNDKIKDSRRLYNIIQILKEEPIITKPQDIIKIFEYYIQNFEKLNYEGQRDEFVTQGLQNAKAELAELTKIINSYNKISKKNQQRIKEAKNKNIKYLNITELYPDFKDWQENLLKEKKILMHELREFEQKIELAKSTTNTTNNIININNSEIKSKIKIFQEKINNISKHTIGLEGLAFYYECQKTKKIINKMEKKLISLKN